MSGGEAQQLRRPDQLLGQSGVWRVERMKRAVESRRKSKMLEER